MRFLHRGSKTNEKIGTEADALTIGVTAALPAGCGGAQPPIVAPGAIPQSRALASRGDSAGYKVLHSFQGKPNDGAFPQASLIDAGGTLYGTTRLGGSDHAGAVFSITKRGKEQLLHSFTKRPDGSRPVASLLDMSDTLYGATYTGGWLARGTVFTITASGAEQVIYRFPDRGRYGGHPAAGLINLGGTLYGTTKAGGINHGRHGDDGRGTVFSVTPGGVENVLHRFTGSPDGEWPYASLIDVGGTLYGTTSAGGANGAGTVFSITASGAENVLYSFGTGTDGKDPRAALVDVGGVLYGTTYSGGTYSKGTVFSITTSGTEKVLYSFGYGTDGSNPAASLLEMNGTLYGTTVAGGAYGLGTVFSLSTSGAEQVMHNFGGGTDGAFPYAALINLNGTLYGTTDQGGATTADPARRRSGNGCTRGMTGCGTVFALTP